MLKTKNVAATHRLLLAASIVSLTVLLNGCASQIDALAPVGGDRMFAVRTAATDLLIEQGYEILEAPICTQTDTDIDCVGELMDGAKVTVHSPVDDATTLTLKVDGETIFDGDYQEVLNKAAGAQ